MKKMLLVAMIIFVNLLGFIGCSRPEKCNVTLSNTLSTSTYAGVDISENGNFIKSIPCGVSTKFEMDRGELSVKLLSITGKSREYTCNVNKDTSVIVTSSVGGWTRK